MKQILFFLVFLASGTSSGQILNGNFQNGSIPSLSNWSNTCGAQSASISPTGGGNWCIQVSSGNTQGCFSGYAYQKLPGIVNGQTFLLSGWAFTQAAPTVGIYFAKINNGVITLQTGTTTAATTWTQLSVQSSFTLSPGDTAAVVLYGGVTGGPVQGYGYFDLVDLQMVTGISDLKQKQFFHIFPNPFSKETTLKTDHVLQNATITIYNSLGKSIKEINGISGDLINIQREDLPGGIYLIELRQNGKIVMVSKLIFTDAF